MRVCGGLKPTQQVLATLGSGASDDPDGWDLGEATNDLFFGKELRAKLLDETLDDDDDDHDHNSHGSLSSSSSMSTWSPTLSGFFKSLTGRRKHKRRPSSAAAAAAVAAATAATETARRTSLASRPNAGGDDNRPERGSAEQRFGLRPSSSPLKRSFTAEEVAEMMRSGAAAAEAAFRAQGFSSSVKRYSNYISSKVAEEQAAGGSGSGGVRSRSSSSGDDGGNGNAGIGDRDGDGGEGSSGSNYITNFVRVPSAAKRLWGPDGIVDPVIVFPARDASDWVSLPDGSSDALQLTAAASPPASSSPLSLPSSTTTTAAAAAALSSAAAALSPSSVSQSSSDTTTTTTNDSSSSSSSSLSSSLPEEASSKPQIEDDKAVTVSANTCSVEVAKAPAPAEPTGDGVLSNAQTMATESIPGAAVNVIVDSFGAVLSSVSSTFQPLLETVDSTALPESESSSSSASGAEAKSAEETVLPTEKQTILDYSVDSAVADVGATVEAAAPSDDSVNAAENGANNAEEQSTRGDSSDGADASGSVFDGANTSGANGSAGGPVGSFDTPEDDHQGLDGSYVAPSASDVLAATATSSAEHLDELPAETNENEGTLPSSNEETQEVNHFPVSGEKVVLSPREK